MGKRVGITGGIGAGKSAVSAYLRKAGETVLDADVFAREVVKPGNAGLSILQERYGEGICHADGTLNRAALAEIVFSSEAERTHINALLHPLIYARLEQEAAAFFAENPQRSLYFEIPLLIETDMQDTMDEVWLVVAREDVRAARVVQRGNTTPEEAKKRIASQLPQEEKLRYAHHVLDNNGSMEELWRQIDALRT